MADNTFRGSNENQDEAVKSWDPFAHARTVIGETHRMIHDGFSFHATHRVAALADAATLSLLIQCPAGVYPHLNALIFSLQNGPVDIATYEGPTFSAAGTVIPIQNRNRASSNEAGMILTHTPTVSVPGDQIHDRYVPQAQSQGNQAAGAISPNMGEEWILAGGEDYLVILTNNSGGEVVLTLEALWYEIGYEN